MSLPKNKQQQLDELFKPYRNIQNHPLKFESATQVVFGDGNPNAAIVIIGEAPGAHEDEMGKPFVGRSGKLLNKVLEKVGLSRSQVYITNVVKCRPPHNRKPTIQEMEQCKRLLLEKEIAIIKPKVIATLGATALEGLLGHPIKVTQMRGKIINWNNIKVMPTFHPAYILRNPKTLETFVLDLDKAAALTEESK